MAVRIPYVRILSISIAVIVLINVCALGACFMVQLGPVASQKAMPARPDRTPSAQPIPGNNQPQTRGAYRQIDGVRKEVAGRYVIKGKRRALVD